MLNIRYFFSTKIASTQNEVLKLFRKYYSWKPNRIFAFYNSQFDKIITQQHLMLMPIDERIATRAHAATNIIEIRNQKIINLNAEVEKLFDRAKSLAIKPCLKQQVVRQKIIDTVKVALQSYLHQNSKQDLLKQTLSLRIVFSSGHGDFGIAARDNGCVFYATVYQPQHNFQQNGVKQFTSKQLNQDINNLTPHKNNEIQNAILINEAKKYGGYSGIKYTKDKILLQSSTGNLGFVFSQNQLTIPRSNKVFMNSLLTQIINNLPNLNMKLVQKDITMQQAYNAQQMIIFEKSRIVPVISLNNHTIGQGKMKLSEKLQNFIDQSLIKGTFIQI